MHFQISNWITSNIWLQINLVIWWKSAQNIYTQHYSWINPQIFKYTWKESTRYILMDQNRPFIPEIIQQLFKYTTKSASRYLNYRIQSIARSTGWRWRWRSQTWRRRSSWWRGWRRRSYDNVVISVVVAWRWWRAQRSFKHDDFAFRLGRFSTLRSMRDQSSNLVWIRD